MRNRLVAPEDAGRIKWVNGTGAAIAAGVVVVLAGIGLGVVHADIPAAAGSLGVLDIAGEFEFTKQSADVLTQGQNVGFDIANQRVDSTKIGNLTVMAAAGSGVTKCRVKLNPGKPYTIKYVTTAGDNTANLATLDTGLGVNPTGPWLVQIGASAAGVMRAPQGTVVWTTGTVVVTDSGLGTSEVIHLSIWP